MRTYIANVGVGGYYLAVRVANIMAPTVRAYGDCVRQYFLPVFDDLNTKAEEVANQAYDELMQQSVTDEMDDPGDAAEAANERGQEFYDTMFAMRQSTLNMFTAGLFHLLEQQLASLGEDATFQAMGVPLPEVKLDETAMWYQKYLRLDLTGFQEWNKITEELRRIANAVKHGEGQPLDAFASSVRTFSSTHDSRSSDSGTWATSPPRGASQHHSLGMICS